MVFDPNFTPVGRGLQRLRERAAVSEHKEKIARSSKHGHGVPGGSARHLWLELAAVVGLIAGIAAAVIYLPGLV